MNNDLSQQEIFFEIVYERETVNCQVFEISKLIP